MGTGPIVLAYMAVGRLLVWIAETSGPTKRIWNLHPFLTELGECDFCLGCWIFPPLAAYFSVNFTAPLYVPVASEIITGIATAFIVHLVRLGWQTKFGVHILE